MNQVALEAREEMAAWISRQDSWDYFLTVTFRKPSLRPELSIGRVQRTLDGLGGSQRAFLGAEKAHGLGAWHVHGLCKLSWPLRATHVWEALFRSCGRSKVEVPRSPEAVSNYISKYLTKDRMGAYILLGEAWRK